MKTFRAAVLATTIQFVAPPTELRAAPSNDSSALGALRRRLSVWLASPENRRVVWFALWAVLVLLFGLLTGVILSMSHWLTGSYDVGLYVVAGLWASFFGFATLFGLPPGAINALIGALIGVSIDKASTDGGVLKIAAAQVQHVSDAIASSLSIDPHQATLLVWLFVAVYVVCCLPSLVISQK
jgi:hypothetical protein